MAEEPVLTHYIPDLFVKRRKKQMNSKKTLEYQNRAQSGKKYEM